MILKTESSPDYGQGRGVPPTRVSTNMALAPYRDTVGVRMGRAMYVFVLITQQEIFEERVATSKDAAWYTTGF